MKQFFGGWKRDKPDPRDIIKKSSIKRGVDLSNIDMRTTGFMPPVYDQGATSSCTGNAIAGNVEYMRAKEQLPNFMPSRLFIYYNERVMEGDPQDDSGAEIRDGFKSIQVQGVCPENMWPFEASNITVKPVQAAYDFAIKDVIKTYERVGSDLKSIQGVLSRGMPLVFGIEVFENFMAQDVVDTGMVPMPSGKLLGGHAILMVGTKGNQFIFRNSWGTDWGDSGYGLIPQAYVLNTNLCGDLWAIDVA